MKTTDPLMLFPMMKKVATIQLQMEGKSIRDPIQKI